MMIARVGRLVYLSLLLSEARFLRSSGHRLGTVWKAIKSPLKRFANFWRLRENAPIEREQATLVQLTA
jgi:hypothetical protein